MIIGFHNFEKLVEKSRTTGGRNDKVRDADMVADEVQLDWEAEMAAITAEAEVAAGEELAAGLSEAVEENGVAWW